MAYQFSPLIVVLFLAAITAVGLVGLVFARVWRVGEASAESRWFIAVAVLAGLWSFAYALQLLHTDLPGKLYWWRVVWLGVAGLAVAWPAFVLAFTGHRRWLTGPRIALLSVGPGVALVSAWVPSMQPLLAADPTLRTAAGVVVMGFQPGLVLIGFALYTLSVDVVALVLLARAARRARDIFRRQYAILFVVGALPFAGALLQLTGLSPLAPMDLTPLLFGVSIPVVAWTLVRYRLLDLVPVAREHVLEHMENGVLVLDAEDRVLECNPAAARFLGVDAEGILGRDVRTGFDDRPELIDRLVATEDRRIDLPVTASESADRPRTVEVTRSSLLDPDGRDRGLVLVLYDVTEQVERERELELQSDRMEFFNSILRHDVLNGMTVIRSRAKFLLEDLSGEHRRDAETIVSWSDDIVDIVDRVRTVLNTLSGRAETVLEPIDLSGVLRSEVERLRTTHPAVTFETEVPDGMRVLANELLGDILGNVLSNAVDHNDPDGLRVSVEVEAGPDGTTVEIADTGTGIPDAEKESIFRRDVSGRSGPSGSGFGLFFVDTMVTEFGGEVRVRDNDAGGATFVIELRPA